MSATAGATIRPGERTPDATSLVSLLASPGRALSAVFVVVALLSLAQLHVTPFAEVPTLPLAVITLVLLARCFRAALRRLRGADRALLALVALGPISVLWSSDPAATVLSSRALLATTALGLYISMRFDVESQLRLLIVAMSIAAAMSAAEMLVDPVGAVVDDMRGRTWRGAFITKNVFGRAMSLGAIGAAVGLLLHGRRRWPYAFAGVLCGALVVISWSKAALATTAMGVVVVASIAIVLRLRRRPEIGGLIVLATASALVVITIWFAIDPDAALSSVGRDATLTGRTGLWDSVMRSVRDRPWGGFGYGAFWAGWDGPSAEVWVEHPWGPPHAHNGALDLALNLGVAGTALWLTSLVISFRRALRRGPFGSAIRWWPVVLVSFIAVYNVTEVTGPQNHLFWTLYSATSFTLAQRSPPEGGS